MNRGYINLLWLFLLPLLVILLTTAPTLAQTCNSAITPMAPDSRYLDYGNDTIKDLQTGLMWQKCSLGQSGIGCTTGSAFTFTWDQALQQVETLNSSGGFAGYTDWRLPNINELESLVEEACYRPAINTILFPNTLVLVYWSSSPSLYGVWGLSFYGGSSGAGFSRSSREYHIRLVRGGS